MLRHRYMLVRIRTYNNFARCCKLSVQLFYAMSCTAEGPKEFESVLVEVSLCGGELLI